MKSIFVVSSIMVAIISGYFIGVYYEEEKSREKILRMLTENEADNKHLQVSLLSNLIGVYELSEMNKKEALRKLCLLIKMEEKSVSHTIKYKHTDYDIKVIQKADNLIKTAEKENNCDIK